MRWADERYVKLYTKNDPDWLAVPWEARALFHELLKVVDRAGVISIAKSGHVGLALKVNMTPAVVETALNILAKDGCIEVGNGQVVVLNFVEAQETRTTPAARKRVEREAARDQARAITRDVTRSHTESRAVTPSHDPEEPISTQLSLADPFPTETGAGQPAPATRDVATGPETLAPPEKPKRQPRAKKQGDPRIIPLREAWERLYLAATGRQYTPAYPRDHGAIAAMLAVKLGTPPEPITPAEIERRFKNALAQPFYRGPAGHLATVWSHFSGLAATPGTGPTPRDVHRGSVRPSPERPTETRIHTWAGTKTLRVGGET